MRAIFTRSWQQRAQKISFLIFAIIVSFNGPRAFANPELMISHLEMLRKTFATSYAPMRWKREHLGWDLDREIDLVVAGVRSGRIHSVHDYQLALLRFFNSTQDYHVTLNLLLREQANLPLQVKSSADGRFFIVYLDREQLPENQFPFREGDEIISFAGQPVANIIRELSEYESAGNAETRQALAEIRLTNRRAALGHTVPQGEIELTLRRRGQGPPLSAKLTWNYTPESLAFSHENTNPLDINPGRSRAMTGGGRNRDTIDNPIQRLLDRRMEKTGLEEFAAANRFSPGARESYVPDLGSKTFEHSRGFFHTRIFRLANGKNVGVVRIPSYSGGETETQEFIQVVRVLEARTDALVIDQVGNPGGSLPFLYSLASLLTKQALRTPHHHLALTQNDVVEAEETIRLLARVGTDAQARAVIGNTVGGYPVDRALATRLVQYANFILQEWRAGRRYTQPFFIVGVDQIEPHPAVQYSKPILVLIDNLDFSGGDFFPAILQDNGRAKIMGTRTAGAGGFLVSVRGVNLFGIRDMQITGSLAERSNDRPIENLGVTPDIPYRLSSADLSAGFSDWRAAIIAAVEKL